MKMKVHRRMLGNGPWLCYFCNESVSEDVLHGHHVDHDHKNNTEGNVVPSHEACHIKYHNALHGPITDERRAEISARQTGVPKSEGHKSKMSATANARQIHTCECGREIKGLGPLRRHQSTTCTRRAA